LRRRSAPGVARERRVERVQHAVEDRLVGGAMAEGWACYAVDLMEEIGFLSPLER
jgi:uncharacterized protein (DUF885 family)